jgi:hypothetical protein
MQNTPIHSVRAHVQMEGDTIEVIQHLKREIHGSQKEAQLATDQLKEVCIHSCV